jgi:hypothetical protein
MDAEYLLIAVIFVAGMFAGVFLIFLAMRGRSEALERQHRERMAMIERGHIPLAEPHVSRASSRSLSLGIIIVGLGFALMMIISFAGGAPDSGVGIGGAIVLVGAAFIVRSLVVRSETPHPTPPRVPPSPPQAGV